MPREAGCGKTVRGEEAPRTHLVLTFPWVQGGRLCAGRVGGRLQESWTCWVSKAGGGLPALPSGETCRGRSRPVDFIGLALKIESTF